MPDRRTRFHEAPDSPYDVSTNNSPALPSHTFSNTSHSSGFTHILPPTSPLSRPGYARLSSDATAVERTTPPTIAEDDESGNGLGITSTEALPSVNIRRASTHSITRRAVPSSTESPNLRSPDITLSPPTASDPLFSRSPYGSADNTPDLSRERTGASEGVGSYDEFRRGILKHTHTHAYANDSTNDFQQYLHTSDAERMRGAPSIKSAYENNFHPAHECGTKRDFYNGRLSWLNITIIVICLFSTIFSGIFLVLALKAPRYGRWISTSENAGLRPADAILLTSIFAKLIELSFVTCFVAFLGQVLSRRAFMKGAGRGVTLSELSMWRWVVQPGSLITHWETAKYAGLSLLGILSLLSAILATFYSSAATAVVQPMLKQGFWDNMVMAGNVKTDFANINYVKASCRSPIRNDKVQQGATCTQIEHAGQGYHNYQRYLAEWDQVVRSGNGTTDQSARHPGFGLLYENTTITGQWINVIDTPDVSKKHGRAINNVSLAIPHAGVFAAARDERNNILQPEELNSEGTYSLRASVPSPVMNVLCVNMNKKELAPIVFNEWNNVPVNISNWDTVRVNATTTNNTVVDDIFGWTKKMPNGVDYPPVFSRLPMSFNTVMNHTNYAWGRGAIYLLAQGGPSDDGSDLTGVFSLCKMQLSITPNCSTRYNVTGSGGTMEALCEDRDKSMRYIMSQPNATVVDNVANWRDVGFDWSNSLSLNTGLMDANASNSRLLSQLMLQPKNPDPKNFDVDLSKVLPSMGEALAVMASCTLLKSMLDTPFVTFWNYTVPILDQPQTQYFNASLRAQQYASGGVDNASKGWILVLFLVFIMNIFVLSYFIFHRGLVTDFSEPPNLFALAVNSPPSHVLAGSCGGGPEGKQYMVNWFVNHEGEHLYMEPGEKHPLLADDAQHGHPHVHTHDAPHTPPSAGKSGMFASVTNAFGKLKMPRMPFGSRANAPTKLSPAGGAERFRPVSVVGSPRDLEMEEGIVHTRTQKQYAKLANRRSML